jgi:DNA repair exonuclease SbcCD ATPase subunit
VSALAQPEQGAIDGLVTWWRFPTERATFGADRTLRERAFRQVDQREEGKCVADERLSDELIRRIREDEAFRRALLEVLLGEEFLHLPPTVRRIEEALQRLVQVFEREREEARERQRRIDEQIERLGHRIDQLAGRVEAQIEALTQRMERVEAQIAVLAQRVDDLTQRMERVEAQIEALTQRMERVEAQIAVLAQRVDDLTQRMERVEAQIEALTQRMERVEAQIEALTQRMERMESEMRLMRTRLDHYVGLTLELRYHQRASAIFGRYLRRVRSGTAGDVSDRIVDELSEPEAEEAFAIDLLVRGTPRKKPELGEVWVAIEVSSVVDRYDVERAIRRAVLLHRVHPHVLPAVAGEGLTEGAEELARSEGVVIVRDGMVSGWEEAVARWLGQSDGIRAP